jgi:hypothetical protein
MVIYEPNAFVQFNDTTMAIMYKRDFRQSIPAALADTKGWIILRLFTHMSLKSVTSPEDTR